MSRLTALSLVAALTVGCGDAQVVGIHDVQGDGGSSPLAGETVTVEGVVVGDFQGSNSEGLGGFFVQEEDTDADADPATSEGVWVFQGDDGTSVRQGDRVRVTGEVIEFEGLTEIDVRRGGEVRVAGTAALPSPTAVTLPPDGSGGWESVEGMRVRIAGGPVITATNDLDRFGAVTLARGRRLLQFTECADPDADALGRYARRQEARSILLDDGRGGRDLPVALGGLAPDGDEAGALRAGNALPGVEGVADERFGDYRVQATSIPRVTLLNPRPTEAPAVGGTLKVVSANVLNYFNGDGRGGGFPTERGARTREQFERQEAKIVAALCALDADVIGLVEIENDGHGPESSIRALAAAIRAGCGTAYEIVTAPDPGDDEIRVGLLYRPDQLRAVGRPSALTAPRSVFARNRVPLAASFEVSGDGAAAGEVFTVVVNHLKSKGGSCDDSGIPGDDADDGSGACDGTRVAAARAIVDWLASAPTGVDDSDYLVIGDLNAYRRERPLDVFRDAGYVNVVAAAGRAHGDSCGRDASYVFGGAWGTLDYALASASLSAQVSGAAVWPVNAAEPDALAYYAPAATDDYYRYSDHDPVVVGLRLGDVSATRDRRSGAAPGSELRYLRDRHYRVVPAPPAGPATLVTVGGRAMGIDLAPGGQVSVPRDVTAGAYVLQFRDDFGQVVSHRVVVGP